MATNFKVETINGITHVVFSYRERAEYAQSLKYPDSYNSDGYIAQHVRSHPSIPARYQNEAERHTETLTTVLRRFNPVLMRNQSHGALDSSKLARLASPGISQREFALMASRAYKRRDVQTRQREIRIAVVGDFAYELRVQNPTYTPTLAGLIHTVTLACTMTNVPCAAYGTRGHLAATIGPDGTIADRGRYNPKSAATAVLKDYGDEMNGPTFSLISREGAFVMAYHSAFGASPGSMSGQGGISFARAKGADFVIGIGNFGGDVAPDVHLPAGITFADAIKAIADALDVQAAA